MDFEILHTTRYRYGSPTAEAYGEMRMTPPNLETQTVLKHQLLIDPETPSSAYVDHFGNRVEFFSLPFRHTHLALSNQTLVRTRDVPPPVDALELCVQESRQILGSALTDVFAFLQPTAVVSTSREASQWSRRIFPSKARIGDALQHLTESIHSEFKYQSGSTTNSTPLAEVWRSKTGVCQDFAHIGLSVLRSAGLPARYVCGYIETDAAADGSKLAGAVATHAWIEVLLPGMRWAAIDPTNRQWVNHRYVTVAYGRDYRDAAPFRGTFKGGGRQDLKVQVTMKRVPEKNRP